MSLQLFPFVALFEVPAAAVGATVVALKFHIDLRWRAGRSKRVFIADLPGLNSIIVLSVSTPPCDGSSPRSVSVAFSRDGHTLTDLGLSSNSVFSLLELSCDASIPRSASTLFGRDAHSVTVGTTETMVPA